MRSKTVKESYGYPRKAVVKKYARNIRICTDDAYWLDFSVKRAREFFEAGLQMCDEWGRDQDA